MRVASPPPPPCHLQSETPLAEDSPSKVGLHQKILLPMKPEPAKQEESKASLTGTGPFSSEPSQELQRPAPAPRVPWAARAGRGTARLAASCRGLLQLGGLTAGRRARLLVRPLNAQLSAPARRAQSTAVESSHRRPCNPTGTAITTRPAIISSTRIKQLVCSI